MTRLIRSGSGAGAGLGNVRLAGVHIHHQVFGILIIIGTGIVLVSQTPQGAALDAAAAVFGVGVGLTVDEFALWLHLKDVYWARQGRQSVDAIFCVLVITGALIGGASFVSGRVGHGGMVVVGRRHRHQSRALPDLPAQGQGHDRCHRHRHRRRGAGRRDQAGQARVLVGDAPLRHPAAPGRPRRAPATTSARERWDWLRDLVAGAPS